MLILLLPSYCGGLLLSSLTPIPTRREVLLLSLETDDVEETLLLCVVFTAVPLFDELLVEVFPLLTLEVDTVPLFLLEDEPDLTAELLFLLEDEFDLTVELLLLLEDELDLTAELELLEELLRLTLDVVVAFLSVLREELVVTLLLALLFLFWLEFERE